MLLVIYLPNYDSSKSTSFTLNVAFDVVLSLELKFIAIQRLQEPSFFTQPVCFDINLFVKS